MSFPFGLEVGLPAPTRLRLEAPRSAAALYFFTSAAAGALAGLVVLLILLSAAEFAAQQIGWSSALSAQRRVAPGLVLAVLLTGKIGFLVLGYLGAFGNRRPGGTWDRGTAWQWAFAAVAVVAALLAYRWESRHPVNVGGLRRFAGLSVVGLAAPALLLLSGSVVQVVVEPLVPASWAPGALEAAARLQPFAPVVTTVAVGALALAGWRRGRRTSGTLFGLAFAVWATPTAVQLALSDGSIAGSSLLGSAQRVDSWVTLAVLAAAVRRPNRVQTRRLAFILVGSSLVAFSVDLLLADAAPDWGLVILVLAPVIWRFAGDGRQERLLLSGRVVAAICVWSVLVALAGFTLGAGSGVNVWDVQDRPEWDLLVVPLTFALLCRTEPQTAGPTGAGWRGSSIRVRSPRMSGRRQFVIGAFAGFWAVASAISYIDRATPIEKRTTPGLLVSTVPTGWVPGQCESVVGGDIVSVSEAAAAASVVAIHATREAWERTAAQARAECPEVETAAPFIAANCVWPESSTAEEIRGIAGWRFTVGEATVRCVIDSSGDAIRLILVIMNGPADAQTSRSVEEMLQSLEFT